MPRKKPSGKTPLPSGLAQPTIRALTGAGIKHLEELARLSEDDVRTLHGIGPTAAQGDTGSARIVLGREQRGGGRGRCLHRAVSRGSAVDPEASASDHPPCCA